MATGRKLAQFFVGKMIAIFVALGAAALTVVALMYVLSCVLLSDDRSSDEGKHEE